MAHQNNLNKIAQEFIMIDEFYIRRMERQPHKNPVQTSYPVWRSYGPPKTIDSSQAAKRYGGVVEMTGQRPAVQQGYMRGCPYQHQPNQSVVHQVKPDSTAGEKLSYYEGGVLIMDYSQGKPRARAY